MILWFRIELLLTMVFTLQQIGYFESQKFDLTCYLKNKPLLTTLNCSNNTLKSNKFKNR